MTVKATVDSISNDIKYAQLAMANSAFEFLKRPRFDARRDMPALGLVSLTIILGLAGESGRLLLRYDRLAITEHMEWWRLLSGHFVHLGWPHLLLNLLGCLLVWFLFRRDFGLWQWALIALASIACLDAGFFWLNPSLQWYVGLSGLLHGLFAAGLVAWLRESSWESWLMMGIFVAKIFWEQTAGPLPLTSETAGGPVVVDAHLYGAVGGLLTAALLVVTGKIGGGYNSQHQAQAK